MKPNMMKKWSIALLVAAGAAGLTGCEGMRVDEGASTATNNGNVAVAPNGATLKANLSGNVVDDFGAGMSGVSVYAYGMTTTTDAGGNWVLNNVPVTGVNINSTAQNLEQTTDLTTTGSIYVTYTKSGYAEYRSKITNPAVITHYGTAGGNPNSLVVDNLVASESVQLPQLVNTVTGILINRASYYSAPVGEYDMASGLTVRLVPAVDVANNAYGSAAQTGAGATECYEGCGFYSVGEMVSTTSSTGTFTFTEVPKIPGGYIMRVDQPGYRPMARPNDGTGFSYDYDDSYEAGLTTQLGENLDAWKVSVQADENQNYWWGIDFDVKTTGTLTFLEDLYVGNYLVAANNVVEGITVGGKYGTPDEDSGEDSDDGHNNLAASVDTNEVTVDSNLVDLKTSPLKFIFSGDMIPYAAGELPARSVVVFDSTGAQLSWDTTKTSISGRTLTLQLADATTPAASVTAGTSIFVRLHKDVFADMAGKRLTQTVDPNDYEYSGAGGDSDPAEIVTSNSFYGEYEIIYSNPLIVPTPVSGFAQTNINLAIPTTAKLTVPTAVGEVEMSAVQASDSRVEELFDAMLERNRVDGGGASLVAFLDHANNATNINTFQGNVATVGFTAVHNGIYRLRVRDAGGTLLTAVSGSTEVDVNGGAANITIGGTGGTNTFLDFQADVTDTGTASVSLANVSKGFTVSIVRLNDFGDEVATSAVTITLADNFEPHVAIQNSNLNGQDTQVSGAPANNIAGGAAAITSAATAQVLFACGIGRSDDNGEAEVGNEAFYFPKLNLSASLYDKSNLRAHSETGGLLSTAMNQDASATFTSAEDGTVLAATLAVNARETPLLATTAATESADGTTTTGRSDEFYVASDYDAWGLQQTTAAGLPCTYYMADLNNVTGNFSGNWYPSDAAGVPSSTTAVADDDGVMSTIPASLSNYILSGTYTQALAGGGTSTGSVLIENTAATGCNAPASSTYAFDRTVVLNMTEAVSAPADLAAFKATAAACGQNNVIAGSELDTNLLAIAGPTSGWNNDHLLLTFDDWRTIDDSEHFTDADQNVIANQISEGSSLTDLMQIVGVADANNVSATAGNGRGVLIVDATPPLATSLSSDGTTITIKFDQSVNLADADTAQEEFFLVGNRDAGSVTTTYTFNFTSATVGTVSRDTAYIGPYGQTFNANTTVAISIASSANADTNVPAAVTNSQLAISINAPSTQNVDFSHFFNELSFETADSVTAATTVSRAEMLVESFYMDYSDLQDPNHNSWAFVETYDRYDDQGGPKLVGSDQQGPILQTADPGANLGTLGGNDETFLHLDTSNGISVTSMHATANNDGDSIYSADTTASYTVAGGDVSVAHVWGYGAGAITDNNPTGGEVAVIKLNINDADITEALAYVYRPAAEAVAGYTGTTTIIGAGALNSLGDAGTITVSTNGGVGTVGEVGMRNDDTNNGGNDTLVVEYPATLAGVDNGDILVIQNILVDDIYYSLHINAPAAVDETVTATATTEGALSVPTVDIYKHVYFATANDVDAFQTTDVFGPVQNPDVFTAAGQLTFREDVSTATATWSDVGNDDNAATTIEVAFTGSTTVTDNVVAYTLDAVASGSVNENTTTDKVIGNDAKLTVVTTDLAGQESTTVIQFQKGHGLTGFAVNGGAGNNNDERVVLNIIDGSAID